MSSITPGTVQIEQDGNVIIMMFALTRNWVIFAIRLLRKGNTAIIELKAVSRKTVSNSLFGSLRYCMMNRKLWNKQFRQTTPSSSEKQIYSK